MTTLNHTLSGLTSSMQAIESAHGVDACLAYCESVYSSCYRTEQVLTLKDFIAEDCHQQDQLIRELTESAALYLAVKDGVNLQQEQPESFGGWCNEEDEDGYSESYGFCDNSDVIETYLAEAKQAVLNGLEFVEVVNYKGESEGYEVAEVAKSLQLYKGKYDYL